MPRVWAPVEGPESRLSGPGPARWIDETRSGNPAMFIRSPAGEGSIETPGPEESPNPRVRGHVAQQADGELAVRAAQLARGEDGQLDIARQADAARWNRGRPATLLRCRPDDRLQQGRGPHPLVVVPGHVDGLLEGDRAPHRPPRGVRHHHG